MVLRELWRPVRVDEGEEPRAGLVVDGEMWELASDHYHSGFQETHWLLSYLHEAEDVMGAEEVPAADLVRLLPAAMHDWVREALRARAGMIRQDARSVLDVEERAELHDQADELDRLWAGWQADGTVAADQELELLAAQRQAIADEISTTRADLARDRLGVSVGALPEGIRVRLAAFALTDRLWRNTVIEDLHEHLTDAQMMRCNIATVELVLGLLPAAFADHGLDRAQARAVAEALSAPDRPLPTGATLRQQLGELGAAAYRRDALARSSTLPLEVEVLAQEGVLRNLDWHGTPWWPALVRQAVSPFAAGALMRLLQSPLRARDEDLELWMRERPEPEVVTRAARAFLARRA